MLKSRKWKRKKRKKKKKTVVEKGHGRIEKRDFKLWEAADRCMSYDFCRHNWSRAEVPGQEYQGADWTLADTCGELLQRAFKPPLAVHERQREWEDGMKLVFGGKMVQGLGPQWDDHLMGNFVYSSQKQIHRLRERPR